MKLLHVSDWHLGRSTYGESRAADHAVVLNEIVSVAREHHVDLVVHSGDLFDHARPAVADVHKAIDVLKELTATAPVVVVCGNHDSPEWFRLFAKTLGKDSRIHFVDAPRDPAEAGVLRFTGADGTVARVAALPFVHPNRTIDPFGDVTEWPAEHARRVGLLEQALTAELRRDFDPDREITVFVAHEYVGGANLAGSERLAHTTEHYEIDAATLPAVDYLAFGHIHKPQALPGASVAGRYAGSPIELDFGEEGEEKSVVLVDLKPRRPTEITTVPLTGGRRLRRFDGTLAELRHLAPSVGDELCLITVRNPTHQPDLADQVRDLLPDAVLLQINEISADRKLEVLTDDDITADAEPGMPDLFRDYVAEHGTRSAAADLVVDTFTTLLSAVRDQEEPTLPIEAQLHAPLERHGATAEEAAR